MRFLSYSLTMSLLCASTHAAAQSGGAERIHLNQVGYRPAAPKLVLVSDPGRAAPFSWRLLDQRGGVVASGRTEGSRGDWEPLAGAPTAMVDLSAFRQNGCYRLAVDGVGESHPLCIADDPYAEALPAAVKSYTYQRAGRAVPASWGGAWARAAGHPDTCVLFHASSGRGAEPAISSAGGWYDAGDYNKYIVNAGFSVGMMLQLAEQYPAVVGDGAVGFGGSESSNGRGDLLDELSYELAWMLTMQDPADGGVHHKLTTLEFEGMVMPEKAVAQRYILAKGTAATLDFVACMALAFRVFGRVGEGAYAKTLLSAAERAYEWAEAHPSVAFRNPPGVFTGEYGDGDFADEWQWALTELYISTEDDEYLRTLLSEYAPLRVRFRAGETWVGQMSNLAAYSLLAQASDAADGFGIPPDLRWIVRDQVVAVADTLLAIADTNAYHQPIRDWHWGSTSDVLGAAMVTANAYRATGNEKYLRATQHWTDVVFGANPTGYSFVTGFGAVTPINIHHRPSAADGVAAPVPGFIVGGPNTYQQDTTNGVRYPVPARVHPMRSYVDAEGSYASNEVCLNWNAPLVYVLGFLAATHDR